MDNFIIWASDDADEWVVIGGADSPKEALEKATDEQCYGHILVTGGAYWVTEDTKKLFPLKTEGPSDYYGKEFAIIMNRLNKLEEE